MNNGGEVLSVEVDQEMALLLRVSAEGAGTTPSEALLHFARLGLDTIVAAMRAGISGTGTVTPPPARPRAPKLRNKPSISKPSTPKPYTGQVQPDPLPFDEKPAAIHTLPPPTVTVIAKPAAKPESTCEHVWRYVDHSRRRSDICTLCSLRRAHAHAWRLAALDPFDETDVQHGSCACGATRDFDPQASVVAKSHAGFTLKGSLPPIEPIAAVNTVAVPHQKKTGTVQKCGACGNHPRSQAHADACRGGERARGGPGPHGRNAPAAQAVA